MQPAGSSSAATTSCSSTGRSTTTGRCRRGSARSASPTRSARCARSRRRRGSAARSCGRSASRATASSRVPKVVRWFLMRPLGGEFTPHDEVDEIAWVPRANVPDALTFDVGVEVLEGLSRRPRAPRTRAWRRPRASLRARPGTALRFAAAPLQGRSFRRRAPTPDARGGRTSWRRRVPGASTSGRALRRAASGRAVRPTSRRSARAVPPVANAAFGIGGAMPVSCSRTNARASSTAGLPGGSSGRSRRTVSDPTSNERTHCGESAPPTTSSVEPPPLSQTATDSGTFSAQASTPAKAKSASSSALRTRTRAPAPAASAATRSSLFAARRPGAVTTTSS